MSGLQDNWVVCSGCDGLDAIATLTTDPLTAVGLCQCGEVLYRARPESGGRRMPPRYLAWLMDFVPGGILATDHRHRAYAQTCSRCRQRIPDEAEVPLMLWPPDGGMLAYCDRCQIPGPKGSES